MAVEILERNETLGFIHPLVRAAVEGQVTPHERQAAHARAAAILEEFACEGCVRVPGVFPRERVAALREKTDRFAADETLPARHRTWSGDTFVLRYCQELDPVFAEATAHETVMSWSKECSAAGPPSTP